MAVSAQVDEPRTVCSMPFFIVTPVKASSDEQLGRETEEERQATHRKAAVTLAIVRGRKAEKRLPSLFPRGSRRAQGTELDPSELPEGSLEQLY